MGQCSGKTGAHTMSHAYTDINKWVLRAVKVADLTGDENHVLAKFGEFALVLVHPDKNANVEERVLPNEAKMASNSIFLDPMLLAKAFSAMESEWLGDQHVKLAQTSKSLLSNLCNRLAAQGTQFKSWYSIKQNIGSSSSCMDTIYEVYYLTVLGKGWAQRKINGIFPPMNAISKQNFVQAMINTVSLPNNLGSDKGTQLLKKEIKIKEIQGKSGAKQETYTQRPRGRGNSRGRSRGGPYGKNTRGRGRGGRPVTPKPTAANSAEKKE